MGLARHKGWLKKTGQETPFSDHFVIALDDGFYQMGISHDYTLLTTGQYSGTTEITVNSKTETKSNNCVLDERTGLIWSKTYSNDVGDGSDGLLVWDNHLSWIYVDFAPDPAFTVGALVTGDISGTTGQIRYLDGRNVWVENVSGLGFQMSEDISDDAGSGDATIQIVTPSSADPEDIWEYVRQANIAEFAGHNDWRVPSLHELLSILKPDSTGEFLWPAGDTTVFPMDSSAPFTTGYGFATSCGRGKTYLSYARVRSYYSWELIHGGTKAVTDVAFVLLVRGPDLTKKRPCLVLTPGGSCDGGFFADSVHYQRQGGIWLPRVCTVQTTGQYSGTTDITVNGKTDSMSNETVLDNVTGLMWTRYCSDSVGPSSDGKLLFVDDEGKREDALEYVRQANYASLAGHQDWRLPNLAEIMSIAQEHEDSLDDTYFEDEDVAFWGSTRKVNRPDLVASFTASFPPVSLENDKDTDTLAIRLVRGGHTDDDL